MNSIHLGARRTITVPKIIPMVRRTDLMDESVLLLFLKVLTGSLFVMLVVFIIVEWCRIRRQNLRKKK